MPTAKKCAKSSNSKFCTINQMTYIEQFLSQHIIAYYLSALKGSNDHPMFADYHTHPNFFSLTWQILLFGENIAKSANRAWLIDLIRNNLKMRYDDLKDVSLPQNNQDSQAIAFIKRSFQYIYVQMHQIMVRIILSHLIIADADSLTAEVEQMVREIGYIYPALKAEISFSSAQINLTEWFQHYLTQLLKEKTPKSHFYRFLEKIKQECNLIGSIQKMFERLIAYQDADDERTREKQYESSVYEESRSECMSKFSQEKHFNDYQLFRKKKKIIKDRYKHPTDNSTYITPKKDQSLSIFPQTQKTGLQCFPQNIEESQSHSQSQNQSQNLNSSAFSKLLKKYKKPMVRTIYHSSTKTFVPKKAIGVNGFTAEQYIQNLTANSSLTSNQSMNLLDFGRKASARLTKTSFQTSDGSQFCVPETPKQEPLRKISTQKPVGEQKKLMTRLKI